MRHPRFRQGLEVLQIRHEVVQQPQKQFLLCYYILYSWMPTAGPTNPHGPLTDCGLNSSHLGVSMQHLMKRLGILRRPVRMLACMGNAGQAVIDEHAALRLA